MGDNFVTWTDLFQFVLVLGMMANLILQVSFQKRKKK